ncbi:hypothetical protein [Limnospira maxima]|uniref:hypothetical protein n=1 Tax=Limnospira maxima TaxID=129910 RepID=UPI000587D1E4|nr:hypothetical protein [Limnospira maxima]
MGFTQQKVRDGVFGLRPATEPPAWVAPYDYGKEAGSFVGWVKPNRRLCRLGETQQKVRDGVFGLRPATEPPAWVAPYEYGKEAGRGERFNTTAEKAIALGSRWAIARKCCLSLSNLIDVCNS